MRNSSKHTTTTVSFAGMQGGINVSQAPEMIADTEMQICKNFIYNENSKRLRGRGGLSSPYTTFNKEVEHLYHDIDTNTLLAFLVDRSIQLVNYESNYSIELGTLTGTSKPSCCKFQNKLWIASGGQIQYYDFSGSAGLYTLTNGPIANIIFQRMSRLAAVKTGSDTINYSSVGDGTLWDYDDNDSSMGQFLDVGYGDSGDIVSVVPLATDMIVIKSNGMIYQFAGDTDYSTWTVTNISNNSDPIGVSTATNIGNSVVLLSSRGLKSLTTTMDYGNIATSDIGDNFNSLITENEIYEPEIFHLRRHGMILIRGNKNTNFFVAYNYILGVATTIEFGVDVASIVETSDDIYIATGSTLCKWAKEYLTDNGTQIEYEILTKEVIGSNELLVKSIDSSLSGDQAGTATISTEKLIVKVPTNSRKKIRCNHSTGKIALSITSNSIFKFDHIALEVANL